MYIRLPKKVASIFFIATLLFSCKKDEETNQTVVDTSSTKTTASANSDESNNILSSVDTDLIIDDLAIIELFESSQLINDEGSVGNNSNNKKGKVFGCVTPSINTDSVNNTFTLVYNFDGTVCKDGKTRSGSFTVSTNSIFLKANGTQLTFTYSNFKVAESSGESFSSNGKMVITNLSKIDTINGFHQSIKVTGPDGIGRATVVKVNGDTIQWESDRVRTQTGGANTPLDITDDVIELTGTHGGVSAKGSEYTVTVKSALVGQFCDSVPEPVKGTMDFVNNGLTYSVDFGDGSCDGVLNVSSTFGGATLGPVEVDLPK